MTEESILAAVSGIDANQTYLNSIGNNIANADTVGYKDSTVQFQDLLSEQISGANAPTTGSGGIDPLAIGSGVQVSGNQLDLTEGQLEQTGNPEDVAIQGNGYLVVENGGQQYYTRDGALTTDANGDLTTEGGGLVMGWQANGQGAINSNAPLTPITIPQGETIGATPTSQISVTGNIVAGSTSAETVTVNAYDALGDSVPVTLTFTPLGGDQWSMQGTVPTTAGGTVDLWSTTDPPTVTFNSTTGQVQTVTTNGTTTLTANSDGSWSLPVTTMPTTGTGFTFPAGDTWDVEIPAPNSSDSLTQFNASESMTGSANGYPSGTLSSWSVSSNGTIVGAFTNGATLDLGQIALANFSNPGGLTDEGDGLFAVSANSGQAAVGVPGTGGRGELLGGQLEQSNVDLATELTNLIEAEEAYTANTKVLTTTDQVIQSLEAVQ